MVPKKGHDTFVLRGKGEGAWGSDPPSPQDKVDDYAEVNEGIRELPVLPLLRWVDHRIYAPIREQR